LPTWQVDADLSHPATAVHWTWQPHTNRIGLAVRIEGFNGFHNRRCDGTGRWWLGRWATVLG